MAFRHGKDTVVTVGGTDYSSYTSDSTFGATGDTHDVTVYGASGHAYIGGLTDGTYSMSGHYDDGASSTPGEDFPALLAGTAQTIIVQPTGTGSGNAQRSFSAILDSYDEGFPADDKISWSANWQISGAVTYTDQA